MIDYMESEEALASINKIVQLTNSLIDLSNLGVDIEQVSLKATEQLTLFEIAILAMIINETSMANLTEQKLDEMSKYFNILNLLGIHLDKKVSEMSEAQRLTYEESAEDMQALSRLYTRWKKANKDG